MIQIEREKLEKVLEALKEDRAWLESDAPKEIWDKNNEAITAIKETLAQHDSVQAKPEPEQKPFCYHDGRNIVGKEFADHSDVFPLYTSPNPEQQKPVKFKCTAIKEALAQPEEHNFCPRCGKRNKDIHTCTPPQD